MQRVCNIAVSRLAAGYDVLWWCDMSSHAEWSDVFTEAAMTAYTYLRER